MCYNVGTGLNGRLKGPRLSNTLDGVLRARVPTHVAEAVRKAAEAEGATVATVIRELATSYAVEAGTMPEPNPRRRVRRERVPA